MKSHASPARLALSVLLLASLACSGLPLPLPRPLATATPRPAATAAAGATSSGPATTPPAAQTGPANANTLLAVAVRLDGSQPTLVGYLGDPAQAPFQPPAGRYFVDVLDSSGLVLSLGALSVVAGTPVALPESLAAAGGQADPQQASLLTTLGKFLIEAELTQLDVYDAVSGGFTQPLFAKAVAPGQDSLDQLDAHYAEIGNQEAAVTAAADALQAQLPTAFAQPGGVLAAPAPGQAAGLKDALLGFFGYARDTGKRARERIIAISAGLSPGDKADAFDALRSGFKGDAQNYDDWLAELSSGKFDNQAAQMESDLRLATGFATAAQQAGDTVGEVVKREGGELVTKGVELDVEVFKTALGQLSPDLSKGYDLAEKGAKWAQYIQDFYNNPLNAAGQLTRDQILAKFQERIKSDLADCCPGIPPDVADQIATGVSEQAVNTITGLVLVSGANSTPGAANLKPDQFKTGALAFLAFKNLSAPGQRVPPNWCFTGAVPDKGNSPVPPLSVAPDGTLTGVCKGAIKFPVINWTGSTTGQWDAQSGQVTWTIKMVINELRGLAPKVQTTVRTIEIDGSGPITAADGYVLAQGSATWTDVCKAGSSDDGFNPCLNNSPPDQPTAYSWNGTIDWKMTFNP